MKNPNKNVILILNHPLAPLIRITTAVFRSYNENCQFSKSSILLKALIVEEPVID